MALTKRRVALPEPDRAQRPHKRALLRRLEAILALEDEISGLSDTDLTASITALRDTGDDITEADQVRCFAVVAEAAWRVLGQRPHPNQVLAGLIISDGCIAEVATGEGKTLAATMPVVWFAAAGKGVHVVTANDYLARRDGEWMGRLYERLGLSVAVVSAGDELEVRKTAYAADITYATATELGFDYLRDNLVGSLAYKVQRAPYAAVVDEADSVLIDEARTPLIISGAHAGGSEDLAVYAKVVRGLVADVHYDADEADNTVALTPDGITAVEGALGIENLYDARPAVIAAVDAALRASTLLRADRDYMADENGIHLVDEHTGRILAGRRFTDGLHEALEAKEGLAVQAANVTEASVTVHGYFSRYEILSGTTGTAASDAEELETVYGTQVLTVPTHRPIIRNDASDVLYASTDAKLNALVADIAQRQAKGQPVLVGTPSVEESEIVSARLTGAGIDHAVLNARRHAEEAAVVAQAGRVGAVTVATNMAGRGVDIRLGGSPEALAAADAGIAADEEGVAAIDDVDADVARRYQDALARWTGVCAAERETVLAAGGLYVVGTARHGSRRVDDQLRGRSGRQGEPGETRFYLSCEDDLLRNFAGSHVEALIARAGGGIDAPISHRMVDGIVERSQKKMEVLAAAERKNLRTYDTVITAQRNALYAWRDEILAGSSEQILNRWITRAFTATLENVCARRAPRDADRAEVRRMFVGIVPDRDLDHVVDVVAGARTIDDALEVLVPEVLETALAHWPLEETWRAQMLQRFFAGAVDDLWRGLLADLAALRTGISLRAMGQSNPQFAFSKDARDMFASAVASTERNRLNTFWRTKATLKPAPGTEDGTGEQGDATDGDAQVEAAGGAA